MNRRAVVTGDVAPAHIPPVVAEPVVPTSPAVHADDDVVAAEQARVEAIPGALADDELSYGHLLCRARLRDVLSAPGQDRDNGSRTVTLGAEVLERLRRAVHEP